MTNRREIEAGLVKCLLTIEQGQKQAAEAHDLDALIELDKQEHELVGLATCYSYFHDPLINKVLLDHPHMQRYINLLWERIDILGEYDNRGE